MQFKGAIKQITDIQSGTSKQGKDWTKQNVLVEEINTEHPNSLVFEAFNKPLDGLAVGMVVNVEYNGKANEYNGKLYNSLLIWKIEVAGGVQPAQSTEIVNPPNPIDDDTNDLPF